MKKLDRLDRFKLLCQVKRLLMRIEQMTEEERAEKWHIKNCVTGSLYHLIENLLDDAKRELNLPKEVIDELQK